MIREKKDRERIIDLTGPDGNSFALMGYAKTFARQLNLDWSVVQSDMTSGDYEHLIKTFDRYFGDYVILEGYFGT